MQLSENPYASGVLNQSVHAPLVARLTEFAADANIPPAYVWTSIKADPAITASEIAYLTEIRSQHLSGRCGIVYESAASDRDLLRTMELMAGWMLRNFVRARVAPLAEVLQGLAKGYVPDHKLLLIPDFCVATATKRRLQVDVPRITRLIIARRAKQLHTVVNVSSLVTMRQMYGPIIAPTIENHYLRVDLGKGPSAAAA